MSGAEAVRMAGIVKRFGRILANDGADLDTFPDSGNAQRVKEYEARGFKFTDVTIAWWARQPSDSMSAIGDLAKIAAHEK